MKLPIFAMMSVPFTSNPRQSRPRCVAQAGRGTAPQPKARSEAEDGSEQTFLVREERLHAGGRKFGQSRCGQTGERQRPDGNERIDTRPCMARRGIQGNGIGQDADIMDTGERVLEDHLGSGSVLSQGIASGARHRSGVGVSVPSAGRRQSVDRSSAQTGDRLPSHPRHSGREA
ncbi:MAG: hypothetical protein IE921_01870 [Rhodobacteraceae bacterium]|nr:hypothetical protein [Paracoccaceae bacterium]